MFLERSMSQADGIGWIEVICGSMFSGKTEELLSCLLYTSDAADEGLGVDLGGRRFI